MLISKRHTEFLISTNRAAFETDANGAIKTKVIEGVEYQVLRVTASDVLHYCLP